MAYNRDFEANLHKFTNTFLYFIFIHTKEYVLGDGKNVVGTPWEMIILDDLLLRSKGGDVYGYSSIIELFPELKLGKYTNNQPRSQVKRDPGNEVDQQHV